MKTPQIKILACVFRCFKVSERRMQQCRHDIVHAFKALHDRACKCNWSLGPWDLGDSGTAPTVSIISYIWKISAFQIFTIVWLTKEDLKMSVNTVQHNNSHRSCPALDFSKDYSFVLSCVSHLQNLFFFTMKVRWIPSLPLYETFITALTPRRASQGLLDTWALSIFCL